jgi:hypothetical protein
VYVVRGINWCANRSCVDRLPASSYRDRHCALHNGRGVKSKRLSVDRGSCIFRLPRRFDAIDLWCCSAKPLIMSLRGAAIQIIDHLIASAHSVPPRACCIDERAQSIRGLYWAAAIHRTAAA